MRRRLLIPLVPGPDSGFANAARRLTAGALAAARPGTKPFLA
jgi:hypothetical protein